MLRDRRVRGDRELFDGDADGHSGGQQHADGRRQGQPQQQERLGEHAGHPEQQQPAYPNPQGDQPAGHHSGGLRRQHHAPGAAADRVVGGGRAQHVHPAGEGRIEELDILPALKGLGF
ncbi:hypothetical protein, partial [Micromonospora sp. MP36]|uniref:hypothetical protein n=1 Tax=Micromonospora sp. MP36 TaxID=2604468 RepID=UPI001CA374D7